MAKEFLFRWLVIIVSVFCAGCNHLFYFPHKDIYVTPDKAQLQYREITMPTKDPHVVLHGWHISAASPSQKTAVLQFHGNAENRSTHFLSVAWLAKHGADVIVFDYRGYNGSTGNPSREGLVDDGVVAIEWMVKEFQGFRHYVIGQSLGGAVAVPAVTLANARLDGLILESAFHSYRGIGRMKLAGVWLTWPLQWLPWILLSGDWDPIDSAAKIDVPVLAFHDRDDPVVPFESGALLYAAVPAKNMSFNILEGNRHVGAFTVDRPESRARALKFLGLAN